METPFICFVLLVDCFIINSGALGIGEYWSEADDAHITLPANKPVVTSVDCVHNITYTLTTSDIPVTTQYVLFQAHTQWQEVTLSESPAQSYGHYARGTNVGLYQVMQGITSIASCYLWCRPGNRHANVTVLLFAQVPGFGAPMPGGCNMELPIEDDANMKIDSTVHLHIARLSFQYANKGSARSEPQPSCEASSRKKLRYTIYQYFMKDLSTDEDEYLDAMEKILTWDKRSTYTENLGRVVETLPYDGHTYADFASYREQGVIYSVTVDDTTEPSRRALYVPIRSYGCETKETCTKYSAAHIVCDVILWIVGLLAIFVAFFGHRFFKTEMYLFGHVTLMIIVLLLILRFSSLSIPVDVIVAGTIAVLGGVAWLALWYFKGIPLVAIILPSLVMGFMFSSLLFSYTPFGELHIWSRSVNFGLAFTSGVLVLPVALLYFTKFLNIVCCVFVGTFVFTWSISLYLPGSFKHVIPNTLHKLTSSTYLAADTFAPFVINDVILCCVWVALFVGALSFQVMRERGRPPFPPCPYEQRKRNREERELRPSSVTQSHVENAYGFSHERDPLLGGSSPQRYSSTRNTPSRSSAGSAGTRSTPTAPPAEDNTRIIDPL